MSEVEGEEARTRSSSEGDFSPNFDAEVEESRNLLARYFPDHQRINFFSFPIPTCRRLVLALLSDRLPEYVAFGLDSSKLECFIDRVQYSYYENPFHNFYHALAVMHMSHHLLEITEVGQNLEPGCRLACLLAAFCHDIGHRGFTNAFENNRTMGFQTAGESAFMEKFHASSTTKLLWGEEPWSILNDIHGQEEARMRKWITEAIMITDMRVHASFVKQLEAMEEEAHTLAPNFFINTVVKVSDLSSQTYDQEFAEAWGRRITQEFNNQLVWEDSYGWKNSFPSFCEKEADFYKGQIFFIQVLALPLWRAFLGLAPEAKVQLNQLEENLTIYRELEKSSGCMPFDESGRRKRAMSSPEPPRSNTNSPPRSPNHLHMSPSLHPPSSKILRSAVSCELFELQTTSQDKLHPKNSRSDTVFAFFYIGVVFVAIGMQLMILRLNQ